MRGAEPTEHDPLPVHRELCVNTNVGDGEIIEAAARQGGVITRAQLEALGFTKGMIDHRVRSDRLQVVARGVYRVLPARNEREVLEGALVALPDPVVSHGSAGRLLGLSGVPASMPTVTVSARTTHEFEGASVRRVTVRIPGAHRARTRGLLVTSVSRTVVDLAADMQASAWRRLAQEAVVGGRCSIAAIGRVAASVCGQGRKGSTVVKEFLADELASLSALERRFAEMLRPLRPERQYPAPWDPNLRLDFAFPEAKLAIEVDSYRWHATTERFKADRRRDRDATEHGWRLVRLTSDDADDPDETFRFVVGLLAT